MSVKRNSVSACIGCGTCFKVCPMDVFRIDTENNKSVIAYPENCQTCGQCHLNCPAGAIVLDCTQFSTHLCWLASAERGVRVAGYVAFGADCGCRAGMTGLKWYCPYNLEGMAAMATATVEKSGKVQVKSFVDEELRSQAAELFEHIGMSMSTAINVFLRQSVAEGRLPFKPGYPDAPQVDWGASRAARARVDDSGAVVVPASWWDGDDD